MNIELSLATPEIEKVSFKPGGALENLGGMSACFGDVEVQIIADAFDSNTGFITSLSGSDTVSVIEDIADAIKRAGFKSIKYRVDNEDGRGPARERLFESLKKKINSTE